MEPKEAEPRNAQGGWAARERSATILRSRARRYHEYACSLEKLADAAQRLDEEEDAALWNLLEGNSPR